jgi:hypothetical protein
MLAPTMSSVIRFFTGSFLGSTYATA